MSGLLTVVGNPNRKRRGNRRRRSATAARPRRRRRVLHARRANPVRRHRRRRVSARRRRSNPARRRHRNPIFGGTVGVKDFMHGITGAGVGAIGARLIANGIKNQFAPAASPLVKIGIEALVGIVGGMVVSKFLKQRALGAGLAAGAGVVVLQDIYELYVAPHVPAALKDYQYGNLSEYSYGQLSNWPALNDWAPQGGAAAAMSGANDAYGEGAY